MGPLKPRSASATSELPSGWRARVVVGLQCVTLRVCPVPRCQRLRKCCGPLNLDRPPPPTRLHEMGVRFNFGERQVRTKVKVANSRRQLCSLYFNYVIRRSTRVYEFSVACYQVLFWPRVSPALRRFTSIPVKSNVDNSTSCAGLIIQIGFWVL